MVAYLLALLIVLGALIVGTVICRACGAGQAVAPAVGLATMIAVATLAIQLPGDAVTAAVIGLIVLCGAAALFVRGGIGRIDLGALVAALGAVALLSLQFLSANRIGIPGIQVNNDTATHLLWTEGLRSDLVATLYPPNSGYPLGPHSLIAAIAQGTGATAANVLVGLLIATPVLIALTAAIVLRPAPLLLRAPAAALVSLTYLGAAWFGQGAFKEPMMSLFLLAFALAVAACLTARERPRTGGLVPAGLIVAGTLLTFSYPAVAWLGAAAVLAIAATLWLRWPGRAGLLTTVRDALVPVGVGAGVAIIATAVEIPRLWRYLHSVGTSPAGGSGGIDASALGNLAGPLPAGEVLGVWPSGEFRGLPAPHWYLLELKGVALVAAIGGALYLIQRRSPRDLGLIAALGAGVIVWLLSDRGQSPYVTAKSMVIVAPFVTLVAFRALLPVTWPRLARPRAIAAGQIAVAGLLAVGLLWSTEVVLRGLPVESSQQRDQLEALRSTVRPGRTLFLGVDDHAGYRLRGVRVGYFPSGPPSPFPISARPGKPWVMGQPPDWDSLDARTLDQFRFVITVRSAFMSEPPPNFRPIKQNGLYQVWERTEPTQSRSTIESADVPAVPLDCKTAKGRRIARQPGEAAVEVQPFIPLMTDVPGLPLGGSSQVPIQLPAGTWNLAARYRSTTPLRIMYGSLRVGGLSPNTDWPGPYWSAGKIVSDGRPQQLVVIAERETRFGGSAVPASISALVAVSDKGEKVVPLKQACGKYIDWYRKS
jgi:hypothetical protein